jgi:hypothetical protein
VANKLSNEEELFAQMREEKIVIPQAVWEEIFLGIEDRISAINLIIGYCLETSQPLPLDEIKRILGMIQDVYAVFRSRINPVVVQTQEKGLFKAREEDKRVHPVLRIILSHYIGNDVLAINFILGEKVDSQEPCGTEDCQKILGRTKSISEILEKVRMNSETSYEKIRGKLSFPITYLNYLIEHPGDVAPGKIKQALECLRQINKLLSEGGPAL